MRADKLVKELQELLEKDAELDVQVVGYFTISVTGDFTHEHITLT